MGNSEISKILKAYIEKDEISSENEVPKRYRIRYVAALLKIIQETDGANLKTKINAHINSYGAINFIKYKQDIFEALANNYWNNDAIKRAAIKEIFYSCLEKDEQKREEGIATVMWTSRSRLRTVSSFFRTSIDKGTLRQISEKLDELPKTITRRHTS